MRTTLSELRRQGSRLPAAGAHPPHQGRHSPGHRFRSIWGDEPSQRLQLPLSQWHRVDRSDPASDARPAKYPVGAMLDGFAWKSEEGFVECGGNDLVDSHSVDGLLLPRRDEPHVMIPTTRCVAWPLKP